MLQKEWVGVAHIPACLYDRCCHIGGVEGLARLWNVITFKRAKHTEIPLTFH